MVMPWADNYALIGNRKYARIYAKMATGSNVEQREVPAEDIKKRVMDALESVAVLANHDAITQGLNSKGISLLEVKNRMMAQYLQDLIVIIHQKLGGTSIKDHPAIWRLIENRTYMEKLLFTEQKLQYEINKLVKKHHFGEAGEPDGLKFKPNMDNFDVESDDEDDEEEEEEDKSGKEEEEKEVGKKKQGKGVYRPPKVAPMPYAGDETVQEKEKKVKKRALSNALLADLRSELLDEPEEIVDSADLHRLHANKRRKERQEYEEKYFVRTSVSKKEKNNSRQMATVYGLDGLAKFDNFFGDEDMNGPPAKKRKSSKGFKGKGKGKKGKGKKKH